ncbi:MAG TPA: alpha/beta hydrolase [Alcanivoracaceae bacterium]|nr:alpha/beta hydrolase [Alcanivoracaceae bacterium]
MNQHKATSSALLRGILSTTLKLTVKPLFAMNTPTWLRRQGLEIASLSTFNARGVKRIKVDLNGVPSVRFGNPTADKAILYLHGGAYLTGSANTHAALTTHLAQEADAVVFAPNYRLAPEHPFPAARRDAFMAYKALLELGFAPNQITVAGDSAGGGLTLSLLLYLKEQDMPLPEKMILISPWADLTHTHAAASRQPDETMLSWVGLNSAAKRYAGRQPVSHPGISPALTSLKGMPPALIIVGTEEILLTDVRILAEKLKREKVPTDLRIYENMWHVFPLHTRVLQEADHAVQTMANFVRQ